MDAVEFDEDKILACVEYDHTMYVVNRKSKAVIQKVENSFGSGCPTRINLLSDYNIHMNPRGFIKSNIGIQQIDFKNMSLKSLITAAQS